MPWSWAGWRPLGFGLVPVDTPFTFVEYQFPWSVAESVLEAWQSWLPGSPRRTWSAVELTTQMPRAHATPAVAVELVHAGAPGEVDAIVADLLDAVGVPPTHRESDSGPFVDVEGDFYCKGLRPKECTMAGKTAAGEFPRSALLLEIGRRLGALAERRPQDAERVDRRSVNAIGP